MGAAGQVGQLALGGLGLMQADRQARDARDAQNAYLARFDQAYNQVKGWIDEMKNRGAFDSTKQIDALKGLVAQQGQVDMNNSAGAARIMGYQPGDTPGTDALAKAMATNQRFFSNQAMQIRDNALQNEFQGIGALTNAAGILNGGGSMIQNRYNQAQAGLGNAAAGFGNIIGNTDWNAFKMPGARNSNVAVSQAAKYGVQGAGLLGNYGR